LLISKIYISALLIAPMNLYAQANATFADFSPAFLNLEHDGSVIFNVAVANRQSAPLKIQIRILAVDNAGGQVAQTAELRDDISTYGIKRFIAVVKLSEAVRSRRLEGVASLQVLGTDGIFRDVSERRIVIDRSYSFYLDLITFGAIVCAALTLLACVVKAKIKIRHLGAAMGMPNWELNSSWASNIAAAGSVFGTVVTVVVMSDPVFGQSRQLWLGQYLLFAAIAGLAPFLYNTIPTTPAARSSSPSPEGSLSGYFGMYLLCALLTSWAVFGQLFSVTLLVAEISRLDLWGDATASVFLAIGFILIAGVFVHLYRSVLFTSAEALDRPMGPDLNERYSSLPRWKVL